MSALIKYNFSWKCVSITIDIIIWLSYHWLYVLSCFSFSIITFITTLSKYEDYICSCLKDGLRC